MPKQNKFGGVIITENSFGLVMQTPNGRILLSNELVELFNELLQNTQRCEKNIKAQNDLINEYIGSVGVEL